MCGPAAQTVSHGSRFGGQGQGAVGESGVQKWNPCSHARHAHNAAARDTSRRAPVPYLPKVPHCACDSQGEPPKAKHPQKSRSNAPVDLHATHFPRVCTPHYPARPTMPPALGATCAPHTTTLMPRARSTRASWQGTRGPVPVTASQRPATTPVTTPADDPGATSACELPCALQALFSFFFLQGHHGAPPGITVLGRTGPRHP